MPRCHWQDPEGQATIKQIVKVKIPTFRGAAMHSVRYQARGAHFWYFAARLRMLNLPRSSQVARLVQLEQEFLDGWSCMWSFMLSGSLQVRQLILLWTVSPTSCVAHEDKLGHAWWIFFGRIVCEKDKSFSWTYSESMFGWLSGCL